MEKKFVTFLETRGYNASGESARVNVNVSGKFNRSKALGIGRDLHREILTRACENARTLSYCEKQWNARGEAAIPDIANKLKKVASGVWTTIVKLLTSLVERVKEFIKGFTDIETKWKNLPKAITKVQNQPAREVSAEAKDKKMSITVIKGTTPDDLVKDISASIDGVLSASGPLQKITSAETISAALDSSAPNWKADNYSEGDFKQHLQSKEYTKAIAKVSEISVKELLIKEEVTADEAFKVSGEMLRQYKTVAGTIVNLKLIDKLKTLIKNLEQAKKVVASIAKTGKLTIKGDDETAKLADKAGNFIRTLISSSIMKAATSINIVKSMYGVLYNHAKSCIVVYSKTNTKAK